MRISIPILDAWPRTLSIERNVQIPWQQLKIMTRARFSGSGSVP